MKVILKIVIGCLFVISFYIINNYYKYSNIVVKKTPIPNIIEAMPIDNVNVPIGKLIIPAHQIEEKIFNDGTKGNIFLAQSSDYLTKEDGNIILNTNLLLNNMLLDEHVILDVEDICYVFVIKQIGTLAEYKNALELSDRKILYLINESNNIFIKAEEFYKNNPYKVT